MENKNIKFKFLNRTTLQVIGFLLIILSAVTLLWQSNKMSNQSVSTTPATVYFVGEYRIGEGEWKEIKKGEHISSTKGDVTLRGNFHMLKPNGEYWKMFTGGTPIAFYTNHINVTFCEVDRNPYSIDNENPKIGVSACGEKWTSHYFSNASEPIEIIVHNPHAFGNENAIDELLENVVFWNGTESEKIVLEKGETQRNLGFFFIMASVMFLGTALFCSLIHIKNSKTIWLMGLVILFAGLYIAYNSSGISFWSDSVVSNTITSGASMILYSFFLSTLITSHFNATKRIGLITSIGLGVLNALLFILSLVTKLYFYDALLYWVILQSAVNLILLGCLVKEFLTEKSNRKFVYLVATLPLLSFGIDAIATWLGAWENGAISRFSFVVLFAIAIVILLRIIPKSINAITKAKELESEKLLLNTQLAESRVSTMMSQIRPHFIYNTLGSIEQLCELDPPKAGELVHNFAKYLRGNFGELDNPKPILMSQEMEHVHHYVNIENVRFPDMTFTFEMNSNDFHIPALTIQPIVENAIKHGLMKLQKGGTIRVVSYETDTHFCVLVEDDGVGFDTNLLLDERKHVGIRNIRGRLKAMVGGTLEIESNIGEGTKVVIKIPKEEQK